MLTWARTQAAGAVAATTPIQLRPSFRLGMAFVGLAQVCKPQTIWCRPSTAMEAYDTAKATDGERIEARVVVFEICLQAPDRRRR